jgi:threonine/homoserine/homoserine lactone efflux protein
VAFETVKLLGVAYLLYMAWATWRDTTELSAAPEPAPRSTLRVIGAAILTNLLNPKLTLFFFAFLPQFVPRHGHGQLGRMLLLSAVFMAMTLAVFAVYSVLAAALRTRILARPRIVRRLRRAFAASFVALGARLAITARS